MLDDDGKETVTRLCVKAFPSPDFFLVSVPTGIFFGELGLVGSGNESHIIRVIADDFPLKMGEMSQRVSY